MEQQVQQAVEQALQAANSQARKSLEQRGDRDACGFAWVDVYGVRANSKLGKALLASGFTRNGYQRSLQYWNPSRLGVQSVGILEDGAEAFARVLKEQLGLERVYAGSRLD